MSDFSEVDTCNADGCTIDTRLAADTELVGRTKAISVDIVSDVICPWCYVAKRQFERAVAGLPSEVKLSVHWVPFELNPNMPREGLDRTAYRSRKFGSWAHSQKLDAQVTAAATQAGLAMRHDLMTRTPNTFDAHRLIWLAGQEGVQDAVVEGLFRAYFVEGRDVGEKAVLEDVAAAAGIDRERVCSFLAGSEGTGEVAAAETGAQRSGMGGVPTFVINGRTAFSGAQRAELMLAHLMKAVGPS
ncbi:MAG: DsbA family oxidoreductase [Reyranella sp.]|nr:DsbA family oxidoreductase [Reyranella sp.]